MNICIVKYGNLGISETFIRHQVLGLPAMVTVVEGRIPSVEGRPVRSQAWLSRLPQRAVCLLSGRDGHWEIASSYMKAFRRYRASAVLAEYGPTGVRVLEACKRTRIPLIVHFHGFDASRRDVLDEHVKTYPILFQEAAGMIAVSRAMQRKLISLGAPEDKVHYNAYGVDCKAFSGANPATAPPIFLTVGRFVEKKAPQLTLLAFAHVYRVCPEARLRMIGDGPLWGACRDLAQALEIEEAVTFLGAQPHPIVMDEMRGVRCFVQHSIEATSGDSEGTPVGILEAGASGLPVVSTRHAGIPDVVIDGETGFLVEERDVREMAAHMLRIVQDPPLAGKIGQAARQRIKNHFSIEKSIDQLWGIIQSCIARHSRNSHKNTAPA